MTFKIITFLLLISSTQLVSAEITLCWQTNLYQIAAADWSDVIFREFGDGSVAVMNDAADEFSYSAFTRHLLVFNAEGNLKFRDSFNSAWAEFQGAGNDSSRIFVVFEPENTFNEILRIYENTGNSYSATNFVMQSSDVDNEFECDYSLEQESFNLGQSLYVISNGVLSRYEFSGAPAYLTQSHTAGVFDGNFLISWESDLNSEYQIQKSADMQQWSNIGYPITGTGAKMNWSDPLGTSNVFYRVMTK